MNLNGAVLLGNQDEEREAQIVDRELWRARQLARALKTLDPYLELVFANAKADAPGLVPERWHIRRRNPETIDTYWPLIGDNGEYVEPSMDVIDQLRKRDMWREDTNQEIRRHKAEKKARLEAEALAMRLEKREEFGMRVKAMSNPSIRMGGKGWRASLGDIKREPERQDPRETHEDVEFEE